jgi:hypothetical protein
MMNSLLWNCSVLPSVTTHCNFRFQPASHTGLTKKETTLTAESPKETKILTSDVTIHNNIYLHLQREFLRPSPPMVCIFELLSAGCSWIAATTSSSSLIAATTPSSFHVGVCIFELLSAGCSWIFEFPGLFTPSSTFLSVWVLLSQDLDVSGCHIFRVSARVTLGRVSIDLHHESDKKVALSFILIQK